MPVKIDARDGWHTALGVKQLENRVPLSAKRSRLGVLTLRCSKPKQSQRCWSDVIKSILGFRVIYFIPIELTQLISGSLCSTLIKKFLYRIATRIANLIFSEIN